LKWYLVLQNRKSYLDLFDNFQIWFKILNFLLRKLISYHPGIVIWHGQVMLFVNLLKQY